MRDARFMFISCVFVALLLSNPCLSGNSETGLDRAGPVKFPRSSDVNVGQVKVGLLAQGVFWKGLFRDVEIVTTALTGPPLRPNAGPAITPSVFYTLRYKLAEDGVAENGTYSADFLDDGGGESELGSFAVPAGTDLREWMQSLDVFISFESPLLSVFKLASEIGIRRSFLVLNIDWCVGKELRVFSQIPNVHFWVKGPGTEAKIMDELALPFGPEEQSVVGGETRRTASVFRVPWTIPDPVVPAREPLAEANALPVTFLMIVGLGGVQSRRGVDIALKAFHRAMKMGGEGANLHMILSCTLFPFPVDDWLLDHPNVTVIYQVHTREELSDLVAEADGMLYPSRWEGFGLSMMEALHAGVPVIATDGWPMNELVVAGRNGLLVHADTAGPFHADDHLCTIALFPPQSCKTMLAPRWEVQEAALAEALLAFASDAALRRSLTAPSPHALAARQRAFSAVTRSQVASLPQPTAAIAAPGAQGSAGEWRVRCVERGLEAHGWRVAAELGRHADVELVVEEGERGSGGSAEGDGVARGWMQGGGGEDECLWVGAGGGDGGWRVCPGEERGAEEACVEAVGRLLVRVAWEAEEGRAGREEGRADRRRLAQRLGAAGLRLAAAAESIEGDVERGEDGVGEGFAEGSVWLLRGCAVREAGRAARGAMRRRGGAWREWREGLEEMRDEGALDTALRVYQREHGPLCAKRAAEACREGGAAGEGARVALWLHVQAQQAARDGEAGAG